MNMLLRKGIIRDGDAIIYVDADTYGKGETLAKWAQAHKETEWDVIISPQPHCEHVWTKGDIFKRFGTTWDNPHYGLTQQPKADAMAFKINQRTRKLLRMWEDLLMDFHLVSDEKSNDKSLDGPMHYRKENRHDQSLLSMLLKASVPKSGTCNEPNLKADKLQHPEDEVTGWQRPPEFGIPGLTVEWRSGL